MSNLFFAARPLLLDSLGVLLFAALLALGVDVAVAASAAVILVILQVSVQLFRRKPVAPLQWMVLVLMVVSAGATMLTHDARFVMIKPSALYAVASVVMLRRGWMLRYVPPIATGYVTDAMTVFGFIWAGLMFITGAANLLVVLLWPARWPVFITIAPLSSKLVLFAIQYVIVRNVARRRILAGTEAERTTGAVG